MAAKLCASVILLAVVAAAGCSSKQSLQSWQRGVERYAADHGDPSALRDVTVSGTRRGFAVIGGVDPTKSTDVNAVLLAHKNIDNRPWFIYLVGLVQKQHVSDMHLAAVSFADAKPRWAISAKDAHAVTTYRQHGESQWHGKSAPHAKPPAAYTTFPRDDDEFSITVNGSKIEAAHPPSGAKWSLDLTAHP